MKNNIKKLVIEYQNFMDDILEPNDELEFRDVINNKYIYTPKDTNELRSNIITLLKDGVYNLNCINVSYITDFSFVFYASGDYDWDKIDISLWDVSNGRDFCYMFSKTPNFNADISRWDVSNGRNFNFMFYNCKSFDETKIKNWEIRNDAYKLFMLDKDVTPKILQYYKPGSKTDLEFFIDFALNELDAYDLNFIDVSDITVFSGLFEYWDCKDINISKWNVSNGRDFSKMFNGASNICDISKWNVSNAFDMKFMFADTTEIDIDISKWNVSNVRDMSFMFFNSDFNGNILKWDVSNVEIFTGMFANCPEFSYNVRKWNISSGKEFEGIFYNTGSITTRVLNNTLKYWMENFENAPKDETVYITYPED